MKNLEFLEYIETPGEKHLGIAVIRYEKAIIFRFKISPNAENGGVFCNAQALKIGEKNGKPDYAKAFEFDSTYESKSIIKFTTEKVEAILNKTSVQSNEQFPVPF